MLEVSVRTYYKRLKEGYKGKDSAVSDAVISCFEEHAGNYGRARIRRALLKKGIRVSEWKVSCILKENGLVPKVGRDRRKRNYKRPKAAFISDNLVPNIFETEGRNVVWSADISELWCADGKFYASAILDVGTRKIVGWAIDKRMRQGIVQRTIEMAYKRYRPAPGLIFHSDRGSQYVAKDTKAMLDKYKMVSSMSRPGSPHDNQPIENFWRALKQEITDLSLLPYEKAKQETIKFIELEYNNKRMHSGVDYQTPNEAWDACV